MRPGLGESSSYIIFTNNSIQRLEALSWPRSWYGMMIKRESLSAHSEQDLDWDMLLIRFYKKNLCFFSHKSELKINHSMTEIETKLEIFQIFIGILETCNLSFILKFPIFDIHEISNFFN